MKIKDTRINTTAEIVDSFSLDEYRIFLKVQGLTIATIEFYLKYTLRFINYSQLETIESFNNFLKIKASYHKMFDRELKPSTLDKFRKALLKYYSFLVDNEVVEKNYAKKLVKVKQQKTLPNSLSQEEVEQINTYILDNYSIDFFKYRAYMIFNTLLNT